MSHTNQTPTVFLIASRPLFGFEGVRFQAQSSRGDPELLRAAFSTPDLRAVQWDSRQLRPLKDYLDLSQSYWDNLGAKSLCSYHINLQGGGWHVGEETVHYTAVCMCEYVAACDTFVVNSTAHPKTYKLVNVYRNPETIYICSCLPLFTEDQTAVVMFCTLSLIKNGEWFSHKVFVCISSLAFHSFSLVFLIK